MALPVVGAVLLLAVVGYLQRPLFGRLPDAASVARYEHSPNYQNGKFVDQIDTPIHTNGSSELSILRDSLFGEKGHPRPDGAVPAHRVDFKALNPADDLVIWLGHSSFYVQLNGKRILIDPVFSENAAPIPSANEAFEGTSIYSAADMPSIDYLLISHDHYDHLDYPTVVALREKVGHVIVGLGVGAHFQAWGYDNAQIIEADWYDSAVSTGGISIVATPARHFSGRTFDRDKSLWVGFVVRSGQRSLFFSGDSGYAPHFAQIGDRYGPFDWVALDMGQYDARWANVHMSPVQAAQAAQDLRAAVLTPSHVGRFSLAPHDWDAPFKQIIEASKNQAYTLWTPAIGTLMYLDHRPQSFDRWWDAAK